MKLDTTPQDVTVAGNFETSAFGMEASAHAFDIIADKIYTHKVRAVIREISCNAHDAHIEAGNPDPFDVHLPTSLEPWFSVRDYGVGLSDDDVRFVFCNTFKSTKQDTNSQIGCLGLGSKSPFCLVDSFTVKSWYGGMERTYSCYRDEQRKPNVALLTEVASDEPNGIEVSLSIEGRVHDFENDSVKVFQYWSYTPNINNNRVVKNIDDARQRYKFKGEDFGLTRGWGGMSAVMGNVAYEIPAELDEFDADGYLKFELGEISFDAGRESLSLDDRTKAAIKAKFKEVKDKLADEASQQIDALPTAWERANLAYEFSLGQIGKYIKKSTDLTKYDLPETTEPMTYFVRRYNSTDKGETNRVTFGFDVSYYAFKPKFQTRIRNYLKDENNSTIILLTQAQIAETGIDPNIIQDLETLPKIYRATGGGVGSKIKTFTFDVTCSQYYGRKSRDYWDENELEITTEEMIYVEISRWEPQYDRDALISGSNGSIRSTLSTLTDIGIDKPVVHGLKTAYLKTKDFKTGNWVHLDDYVKREVSKIAPKSYDKYDNSNYQIMETLNKGIKDCSDLEFWSDVAQDRKANSKISDIAERLGLDLEKDTTIQDVHDDFFTKYPLLTLLSSWEIKGNLDKIAPYINGVVK